MKPSTLPEIPWTVVRGFCMGAADLVPGVSGGTIALVFGIYRRLVAAVREGSIALGRFVKLDFAGGVRALRAVEWIFLLPLVAGILTAVLTLAGPIEHALEAYPVQMAGLFMGLVLGSVVVALELIDGITGRRLAVMAAVAVVVFIGLGLGGGKEAAGVAEPPLWAYPAAGAIAICAMILPGISGSFLLVMMGMYQPVLAAVADREWGIVVIFTLGCVVGLALFSQALHWALHHHYGIVMAALIGLMIGSLRVVWPWPGGVASTDLALPGDHLGVTLAHAAAACALVIGINEVAKRLEHRTRTDEVEDLRV
jgi:putative membrane protein